MEYRFHMALPAAPTEFIATDPELAAAMPTEAATSKSGIVFLQHLQDGSYGAAYYGLINGHSCLIKSVSERKGPYPTRRLTDGSFREKQSFGKSSEHIIWFSK